ncbi:glycosyltransferase family 4 protein [Rhizosaccharibacter radicis]|uniref:Glycosyltransferase family 4 protein n=1 Tax=Rhizosaccharibacter radicis TaxID=2782605 RepID=A0ABT1VW84_9PROT|nr:glycosyltransferase family 4 protein [Acetobacteraceae bacterium KSS12]
MPLPGQGATPRPAIWIDVEDLFQYAEHNSRLSGIQRLAGELYRALRDQPDGPAIGFLRIDGSGRAFVPVGWDEVAAVLDGLSGGTGFRSAAVAAGRAPVPAVRRPGRVSRLARAAAKGVRSRLPPEAHGRVDRFKALQSGAIRSLGELRGALGMRSATMPAAPAVPFPGVPAVGGALKQLACPGDWLFSFGATWSNGRYGELLRAAREELGLRTAILFYDLIPLRRPEWCHHTLVEAFGDWIDGVLPELDLCLAISEATAADVRRCLAERRLPARPVLAIPIGTGFEVTTGAAPAKAATEVPPGTRYALYVSTIEARKNHSLLFRAWRRLLDEMPREEVPTLVFAGRIGWLVSDLMQQIENSDFLGGKLRIVADPSDEVLHGLYRDCLFTVFPSLFEGWGLPVSESLMLGKPCLASGTTSVPEAGGALARYFDPDELEELVRLLRTTLADPNDLAAWTARVQREFVPVPWSRTAQAVMAAIEAGAVA